MQKCQTKVPAAKPGEAFVVDPRCDHRWNVATSRRTPSKFVGAWRRSSAAVQRYRWGSRVRDEVLSVEAFDAAPEAQTVVNDGKKNIYNGRCGHASTRGESCRPDEPGADEHEPT